MKKLGILLFIGSLFLSCNDGDFIFDELNFSGSVQKCNTKEVFYKLNGNEMLLLNMTGYFNDTINTPLNQEIKIATNKNEIMYRQYSDKAISGSVCDLIAPAFPQVVDEYRVNSGGEITYKRIRKIAQKPEEAKVLLDYIYNFNFKNIILTNGSKDLKYEDYFFGEYFSSSTSLDFNLGNALFVCQNEEIISTKQNQIFKIISNSIHLNNTTGTQTITLNNTNYLKFYFLNYITNQSEACDMVFTNPNTRILENWTANQGILEIVTTANSTVENPDVILGYTHNFILKNTIFTSETDSFTIAEQNIGRIIKNL